MKNDGQIRIRTAEDRDLEAPLTGHAAEVSVGGVASVGVAPDARRSRVGRALLEGMLARMRSRGMVVSMLYPFKHDFYRKLGWGLVGEMRRYRFRPDALPL